MKRDTDTNKWSLPWFRKASLEAKVLWQFIRDHCDDAGVWLADWELARFQIGAEVGEAQLAEMGGEIRAIGAGRLRVMDYVASQNSNGLGNSHYHRKVAALIEKHRAATEYAYDDPMDAPPAEPTTLFPGATSKAEKQPKDTSPARFTFWCGAKVTEETFNRLAEKYPQVDVEHEILVAMDWLKGKKKKTLSPFSFLSNWMSKKQPTANAAPSSDPLPSPDQCLALGMDKAQINDLIAKRQCAPWPSAS